ncbi:hypothetical protein ACFX13_040543 [Malus domestica]
MGYSLINPRLVKNPRYWRNTMVRRKREQSESQSQNLSTRMVKRKLEDESTTTEEKTEDDVTHNAIIPSPPNVEVRATFIVDNASLIKGVVRKRWNKILDSEEDADFLKQKKDVNDYRPGSCLPGLLLSYNLDVT